jgi:hypothetical protein
VVESGKAATRVARQQRKLRGAGHPNGAIKGEVARDLVPFVLAATDAAPAAGPVADRRLARLDFGETGGGAVPTLAGPCAPTTTACRSGRRCYLWNPRGTTCTARQPLRARARVVEATFRLRVTEFPPAADIREIFGVFEGDFGSGLFVELVETDRLRLLASGKTIGHCGPLPVRLEKDTWYAVRVRGDKSESAHAALDVESDDGRLLGSVACDGQPTGGGTFTEVMVGNTNPMGSTAEIRFDDVEVDVDVPSPAPAG